MRYLPLLFLLPFLTACGPEVIYEKEVDFPSGNWAWADSVSFDYTVQDTSQLYDVFLEVDHGTDFAYQNFYVKILTTPPSGKRFDEQLSLQLAGDFGEWLGDCSGEQCQLSIPYLTDVRFRETGDYRISFEQFSRNEPLAAVDGLGLRITVAEE